MYVTLKKCRISGNRLDAGTILPDGYRPPSHMVSAGYVVYLPDELTKLESFSTGADSEPEIEEEDAPVETQEVVENEVVEEPVDIELSDDEIDEMLQNYHQGAGYYQIGDDRVRGKKEARELLIAKLQG